MPSRSKWEVIKQHKNDIIAVVQKLVLWVVFNVLVALLPFAFRAVNTRLSGKQINWESILSDGELLLVASAVAAGAIGELIVSEKRLVIPRIFVGGGCVISLGLASLLYASIRVQQGTSSTLTSSEIYNWSIYIFLGTFIAGCGCMILSEVKK